MEVENGKSAFVTKKAFFKRWGDGSGGRTETETTCQYERVGRKVASYEEKPGSRAGCLSRWDRRGRVP